MISPHPPVAKESFREKREIDNYVWQTTNPTACPIPKILLHILESH
jgi:hypothetical protein